MAHNIFIGTEIEPFAHKVNKLYLGVDNSARRIKKVYIGDQNGKAQLCYQFDCELTLQVMVTAGMNFDYSITYPSGTVEKGYYNSFGTPASGFNDTGKRIYKTRVPYGSSLTLRLGSWDGKYTWDTSGPHAWPESPQIIKEDTNIQFYPRYKGSTYYTLSLSLGTGVKSVDYNVSGSSGTKTTSDDWSLPFGASYSFTNAQAKSGYTMNAAPSNASGTMPSANRTVSFTATANSGGGTYTVRFYDNSRSPALISTQTVQSGQNATPPSGYTLGSHQPGEFAGWSREYTNIRQNTDIYAKWWVENDYSNWFSAQRVDVGSTTLSILINGEIYKLKKLTYNDHSNNFNITINSSTVSNYHVNISGALDDNFPDWGSHQILMNYSKLVASTQP